METVNEFIEFKSKLIVIKEFMNEVMDKDESGINGGYHLNKAVDELTIAILRLEIGFNIISDPVETDVVLSINSPYKVCIVDIISELDGVNIPLTSNNDIKWVEFLVDNAKMWIREESNRIFKKEH